MLPPGEFNALLDAIARGRSDAFREIVRAYGLPIRSYLAAQLFHLEEIDDLAQEVFIAAYRGLGSFRREDDFGAWLRGIARHKVQTYFRSTARRSNALERFREEVTETIAADLAKSTAADRTLVIERLLHCITGLPERMRRLVRSGLEGQRAAALADELGTTVGAIYTLQYRAHQLLRECLHKELKDGA